MHVSPSFVADFNRAIRKDLSVELVESGGELSCRTQSLTSKWLGRRVSHLGHNLELFTQLLREKLLCSNVFEAREDEIIRAAVEFTRRDMRNLSMEEQRVQTFVQLLWGHRLVIDPETLANPRNAGFLEFAQQAHLHHYLAGNGDTLLIEDGVIHILFEGEGYVPWQTIQEEAESWERPQDHYYHRFEIGNHEAVSRGLHRRSRTDFDELFPVAYDPRKEEGKYYEEVVSWAEMTPGATGIHEYTRVWFGPWGYIPGIYRPDKRGAEIYQNPGMTRPGTYYVKDWTEECEESDEARCHYFLMEITEEQAQAKIDWVNRQVQAPNRPYTVTRSCVWRTSQLMALSGALLPTEVPLLRVFYEELKSRLSTFTDRWLSDSIMKAAGRAFSALELTLATFWKDSPWLLRKVVAESVQIPIGLALNILFATVGGGSLVHPALREERIPLRNIHEIARAIFAFMTTGLPRRCEVEGEVRIYNSIWDVLNPWKIRYIQHPFRRAKESMPLAEIWRRSIGEPLAIPDRRFTAWCDEHAEELSNQARRLADQRDPSHLPRPYRAHEGALASAETLLPLP